MIYNPHEYQQYSTDFIISHPICALFLQMGLGKSVITLTALERLLFDSFEISKILVIAPLRVARDTWKDEIEKWDHLGSLTYSICVGSEKDRIRAFERKADIYIINRENVEWMISSQLVKKDFDCIVIDELSSFKSHTSKRFKALMKLRPSVKRIIGLTGTPAPNGLMDLFAEFRILDMGERLGRFITAFRNTYFIPNRRNQNIIFSYKPKEGAEQLIYEKVSDITLSMSAMDHLEMPALIKNNIIVHMDESETDTYRTLKKEMVASIDGEILTALTAGALSSKLMQAASGAIYKNDESYVELHRRKLDALEERIEAANSQSVLVAYWFRFDKERIEELLTRMHVTYSFLDTREGIRAWKEKKVQVGLMHPASAGHGLNIQSGGNILIWFTVPWSLELYQQTVARLWRQGQQEGTVVIEHIMTASTIDERILRAIEKKDDTQSALMDAVKAVLDE